tara:strand:+ start:69 stop:233 length:165 start_codon:yes stop_codon:yes gene_type:complete
MEILSLSDQSYGVATIIFPLGLFGVELLIRKPFKYLFSCPFAALSLSFFYWKTV